MKFFIILSFCIFSFAFCFAQSDSISVTDKKINDKVFELRGRGVNIIVRYYLLCLGGAMFYYPDSCVAYQPKYLLWHENKEYFIQRFDECKDYPSVQIQPLFFTFIRNNFSKIKSEKLKYPIYKVVNNSKVSFEYSFGVDHSCHYMFEIRIKKNILVKDIDDFAIDTKYDYEKHPNILYVKNQKSMSNKLIGIIEKQVAEYNKSITTKKGAW